MSESKDIQHLTPNQIEKMRRNYAGFARYDHDVQATKQDEQRYRENPGYTPYPRGK